MRNINIDRDPMSSEDVSSYKDFKSILKKHAETTNDLNKIKASKSISWLGIGTGVFVITAVLGGLFLITTFSDFTGDFIKDFKSIFKKHPEVNSNSSSKSPVKSEKEIKITKPLVVDGNFTEFEDKKVVVKKNEWQLIENSSEDPIHNHFDFDLISSDRIEYIKLGDYESIKDLLGLTKGVEFEFVKDKKIFKISVDSKLKINTEKALFKLVKNNWVKVDNKPFEFDELVKPKKMEHGKMGIAIDAVGFGKKFKKFENMIWQPVQPEDIDSSFFGHNWTDGSITKTSVLGVYDITLKDGDLSKQFYGYPVLQKYAYKKALKGYNKKLLKQQDLMKKALKSFNISEGVYTIAKSK